MNDSTNKESDKPMNEMKVQGNLHLLLSSFDQNMETQSITTATDISLQLDALGRERSSTLGSIRDRGLTFGSEFDLGLGLGGVNDGDNFDFGSVSTPRPNVVSADNSSASPRQQSLGQGPEVIPQEKEEGKILPCLPSGAGMPSVQYINFSSGIGKKDGPSNNNIDMNDASQQQSQVKAEDPNFLNGIFGGNDASNQNGNSKLFGHTPPSAVPTSYEGRHFGKRMRSSVSQSLTSPPCMSLEGKLIRLYSSFYFHCVSRVYQGDLGPCLIWKIVA